MSRKLVYDYSTMTKTKGVPCIIARYFWTNTKEYVRQGKKEKAKRVARMSLVKDK
jgi:hypothetical protein